jgi:hypothetical protein
MESKMAEVCFLRENAQSENNHNLSKCKSDVSISGRPKNDVQNRATGGDSGGGKTRKAVKVGDMIRRRIAYGHFAKSESFKDS